jgi:hypothetical protein
LSTAAPRSPPRNRVVNRAFRARPAPGNRLEGAGGGVCFGAVSANAPLLMLGLPKGSLEESTKNLFAKAGWKITTSSRSYRPSIDDPELDGRFIRAQEVSRYVEHGFFDCGLTGEDWIKENNSDVVDVCDLIYSKASTKKSRWVLCVPEASPVKTAAISPANASPPN